MGKPKYKCHSAEVPLYSGVLYVLIGDDLKDTYATAGFTDTLLKDDAWHLSEAVAFMAERDGCMGFFALFKPGATMNTAAHEATHLTNYIMRERGIKLDAYNDEAQAYLMGWVVEQIDWAFTSKQVKAKKTINLSR